VCRQELVQVLDELGLGRTRVEALAALATRSSSVAVREFVAAISQSEQKGTPLIDVLTIQSTTLRQRRSVRAEELAAQAGVKMMAPLMLLVASLLLIIFGPIITTGTGL
jgi:tight adherence protein C